MLISMMKAIGYQVGRFKVRRLMKEAGLISKQPGVHRYKTGGMKRSDIPNQLTRQFDVHSPNEVWCGDITYIWAEGRWRYLTVILDLYTRQVVIRSLKSEWIPEMGYSSVREAKQDISGPDGLLQLATTSSTYTLNSQRNSII
ncbi:Integrase core domain protein [Vibrio spartinae]|uniref:Integrase core domain protein n=1 Tax=Vibrio spartinae TaxID=1918945 RepID=A0A1N6MAH5_9VIBR|nr:Integrase core domain protein [Vibrio spartinae]